MRQKAQLAWLQPDLYGDQVMSYKRPDEEKIAMTTDTRDSSDRHIRAIVYKEGDMYVAQCLEFDIAAQAKDIIALVERVELTIEAEFAACEDAGVAPGDAIPPAPNYYIGLWDKRELNLGRVKIADPTNGVSVEIALAIAA